MQRYLVERTFASGPADFPAAAPSEPVLRARLITQGDSGVVWLRSYLTSDQRRSYCLVDGPSPEAVRHAARSNGLPVDRIHEVSVLDPQAMAALLASNQELS
jgi:hypothetical protein